jgi:hypothetical protein
MSNEIVTTEPKTITIVDTTIPIIEYRGHRVITLATMDKLHHRPEGTAGRNFREHRDKFEEGKHYFHINYQELKSLDEFRRAGIDANSQGITVLTDRGYSMLVKSFNDEFAWEVQDQLVDSYFEKKKPMSTAEFLFEQAKLILEHDTKIKRLEQRQSTSEVHLAETRKELESTTKKAEEAFRAASAALHHKYGDSDHYTIVGFCNKHNIKLQGEEAKVEGAHAADLSRKTGQSIIKIPDGRWGEVNSYHVVGDNRKGAKSNRGGSLQFGMRT